MIGQTAKSYSRIRFSHQDDTQSIRVVDVYPKRHRILQFEDSIQGVMSLDAPHLPVLEYIDVMAASARAFGSVKGNIVIAGAGSCSLFHLFHRRAHDHQRIDIIDNNPLVAELAHRFFRLPKAIGLHCVDFRDYVMNRPAETIDVCFVDCYSAHGVPPHLMTVDFLHHVHAGLADCGTCVFNIWKDRCNALAGSQVKSIMAVFCDIAAVDCKADENLVVVAKKSELGDMPEVVVTTKDRYRVRRLSADHPLSLPTQVSTGDVITDENLSRIMKRVGILAHDASVEPHPNPNDSRCT